MALSFSIPGPLLELAGGRDRIEVDGTAGSAGSAGSVSEALGLLWKQCPALRDRVLTELGEVRPHINLFVDGENVRHSGGLAAPVRDGAEIVILPAVSGG